MNFRRFHIFSERTPTLHGMWVLPLLCGVAAFCLARNDRVAVFTTPATEESRRPLKQEREDIHPVDVQTAFDEASREVRSNLREGSWSENLDGAALRATLLRIKSQKSGSRDDLLARGSEAAGELGSKEGPAGVRWIGENLPSLYRSAMDGWAEVDPQAAFEEIVSTQRFNPCSKETLTTLLQRSAEAGPQALAAAAGRVPWHLFLSENGEPEGLRFAHNLQEIPIGPWIESGVPARLADQHIGLQGFFRLWFKQEPEQAIEGWKSWPESDVRGIDQGLEDLLMAGDDSEGNAATVDQAVANADAVTSARFAAAARRLIEHDPYHDMYGVIEKIPHLHSLIAPAAEAEPQDAGE